VAVAPVAMSQIMSHGAAATKWNSFEINDKHLQHAQHEKAASEGGKI
jgi:hypothetical protein